MDYGRYLQQLRAAVERPRDAWHERHPVIGILLVMLLLGLCGLAIIALVILGADLVVPFT